MYLLNILQIQFILYICVYIIPNIVAAKNPVHAHSINFLTAQMQANSRFIHNFSTSVVNNSLNIEFITLKDVVTGFKTAFDFQLRLPDSKRYQTLLSYDFDVCEILKQLNRPSIINTLYRNVLKHSTVKQNCPIEVGYYSITNLAIDAPNIPSYLASGDYRVNTYHYYGKRKTKKEIMVCHFTTDINIV